MSQSPKMTIRENLAWLAAFWRPHRRFLFFLLGFTLVSSAVAIAYPLVLKTVIDDVVRSIREAHAGHVDLRRPMLVLGLIALGRVVAGFYPGFRGWMNIKLEKDIRERVFESILRKGHGFFGRFRTGDLVTRLTDDIAEFPRIAWFGCSGIFRFVDSMSKFVFCVAVMLYLDVRLALLSLIPLPIMLWVFYLARRALGRTYEQQQEAVARTNNMVESAFSGIRIVKAFNAETGQKRRLAEILQERIGIQLKLAKLVVFVHEMDQIASRAGQAIVLAVGGLMVLDGHMTVGTLVAFYLYLDLLIFPMIDLPNLFVTGRQAFVSIGREEELLRHPDVARRGGVERAPAIAGSAPRPIEAVALEDVGFRYRDDLAAALEHVTLDVRAGSTVAVVGPVASGKSTLLKVMAGLLPASAGAYTVNGTRADDWSWPELRDRIGYVPQESHLFSETIRENVAFGRDVDEPWVRRSLSVAQMDDELAHMAEGLDTRLGQRGTLVSGGQKQRIAIARALAGRPDLLLLDDCTASLDARNEDRFWSDLRRWLPDATVIVVSHRPATIRRADEIVVFDRGRVVDRGTHDALQRRCAVYGEFLLAEERREHLAEATE